MLQHKFLTAIVEEDIVSCHRLGSSSTSCILVHRQDDPPNIFVHRQDDPPNIISLIDGVSTEILVEQIQLTALKSFVSKVINELNIVTIVFVSCTFFHFIYV